MADECKISQGVKVTSIEVRAEQDQRGKGAVVILEFVYGQNTTSHTVPPELITQLANAIRYEQERMRRGLV